MGIKSAGFRVPCTITAWGLPRYEAHQLLSGWSLGSVITQHSIIFSRILQLLDLGRIKSDFLKLTNKNDKTHKTAGDNGIDLEFLFESKDKANN